MSVHFSCNQYEQAFNPKRLQNWEVPKKYKERPRTLEGFTQIIANNRGHLLLGVPRSSDSPWGKFVGTWDMPLKIPGNKMVNPTARSPYAQERLHRFKVEGDKVISGSMKTRARMPTPFFMKQNTSPKPITPEQRIPTAQRSGAGNPLPPLEPLVGGLERSSPVLDIPADIGVPKQYTPPPKMPTPTVDPKPATPGRSPVLSPAGSARIAPKLAPLCSPKPTQSRGAARSATPAEKEQLVA